MAMIYSKKPLFLPLVAFITTFLVLLHKANSLDTVSFNFPKFDDSAKKLILEGDASIDSRSNLLRLTKVDSYAKPLPNRVGRVSYSELVQLRDSSTDTTATFTTSFAFRIRAPDESYPGDGLTFFIASPTLDIGTSGGNLGLIGGPVPASSSDSDDRVVAVEFDTHTNSGIQDPNSPHIGVDVNSVTSRITRGWDWVNGNGVQVTITYLPFTNELKIIATNFSGAKVELVDYINLPDELPDYVKVGFTAATGDNTQTNDIINWSFFSAVGQKHVAEEGAHIASVV